MVRSVVYLLIGFALYGIGCAAIEDYQGVIQMGGAGPNEAARIAVKATNPAEFHYQILLKLLVPGAAMILGAFIHLRWNWWKMISPDALDFAGCHEPYDPATATPLTQETGCAAGDKVTRRHFGTLLRH